MWTLTSTPAMGLHDLLCFSPFRPYVAKLAQCNALWKQSKVAAIATTALTCCSLYIYCSVSLLVAWNVFWHVKETFLCIMLPSMNRFLNFIGHSNQQKKPAKIRILKAAWLLCRVIYSGALFGKDYCMKDHQHRITCRALALLVLVQDLPCLLYESSIFKTPISILVTHSDLYSF